MSHIEIDQRLKETKDALRLMGTKLLEAAERFGANQMTKEILKEQLDNINENFLFVIVGEVNAGKSSFVNALLGSPISATSHEICTQDVQKIIYGEQESSVQNAQDRLIIKTFPAEILKSITVVDTPGTNSRALDHQLITERFVPKSNLILFVFQMDNIHVQSAWELFKMIKKEWTKKVVFILTKSDRYSEEEVQNYTNSLKRYAINEQMEDPLIFVTSAKLEDEGNAERSGFEPIRTYINGQVLKDAALNKAIGDVKVVRKLMGDIDEEFTLRKNKFQKDQAARQKIAKLIQDKEALTKSNIQALTKKCLDTYDLRSQQTIDTLQKGIGFFSFTLKSIKSIFGGQTTQDWLKEVNQQHIKDLNEEINVILASGTDSLKSDITYMVIGVKEALDQLQAVQIKSTEMFVRIDEKRNEAVMALKQNLTDFINKSDVFKGEGLVASNNIDYTGVNVAGGVAAVGGALTFLTNIAVLDITGGLATGLGLLLAGGLAVTQKGKYITAVKEALDEKRALLKEGLNNNLSSYFDQIKLKVNEQFTDFDHHLQSEANQIRLYDELVRELGNELQGIEQKIFS